MGNDNNIKPKATYEKFYQMCHPALVQYDFNQEEQLLCARIKVEESFIIWRKLADPLFQKKHLFMPAKIIGAEHIIDYGCFAQQDFHRADLQFKNVYYQPFIFTLDKQITSRKSKNVFFREQQLWKLLRYISKAVFQWKSVYMNQKIGSLCPFNIIMDQNGQVKFVCRLSFFNLQCNNAIQFYNPPQSRQNSIIKYSLNPNNDPVGIQASTVFSIGMVLLETITLQLSGLSSLQTAQKQAIMQKSNNYSPQLKQLVNKMLEHNQAHRPKLLQLLERARNHKTRRL